MLALGLKILSQRATAEDLVRDAFILIWKNASSYDPAMGDARTWMYSIARYRALSRLRQAGRLRPGDTQGLDTLTGNEAHAAEERVVGAIARMDESERKSGGEGKRGSERGDTG